MLKFDIKDLDKPLEVQEPICCRLCLNTGTKIGSRAFAVLNLNCTHCNTMKACVKALKYQQSIIGEVNAEIKAISERSKSDRLLAISYKYA